MKIVKICKRLALVALVPLVVSCKIPSEDTVVHSLEDRDYYLNVLFKEKARFPLVNPGSKVFIQNGLFYVSSSEINEHESHCVMSLKKTEVSYRSMLQSYGVRSMPLPEDSGIINQHHPAKLVLTKKGDSVRFTFKIWVHTSRMHRDLPPLDISSSFAGTLNCTRGMSFNDSISDLSLGEVRSIFRMRQVMKIVN